MRPDHVEERGPSPGSPGVAADSGATGLESSALKRSLRAMSYEEGAAALRPVQMRADEAVRDEAREQHDARGHEDELAGATSGNRTAFFDKGAREDDPEIDYDHGFLEGEDGELDRSKMEEPTLADYLALAKWIAKAEAAALLRPDLVDGIAAYRYFLSGGGAPRDFDYDRFLETDPAGHRVISSLEYDLKYGAADLDDQFRRGSAGDISGKPHHFDMNTGVIPVGGDARFPYPATENWQKAIGGHNIWIDATVDVTVSGEGEEQVRTFEIAYTINAEDMYNFNPGQADMATGVPDSDNGRFEITGLGNEYLNTSKVERQLVFVQPLDHWEFEESEELDSTGGGGDRAPGRDAGGRSPGR